MKYSLCPYELKIKKTNAVKSGYLLRVESPSGAFGYADLFPWTQFGDPSFEEIPKLLTRKDQSFPLINRALERAELDLKAREGGVDLTGSLNFQNHFLLRNTEAIDEVENALSVGFVKFKLKCGGDLQKELRFLKSLQSRFGKDILLRLDFNAQLDKKDESSFWPYLELLDFVEDPYTDPLDWQTSRFPLAFDHPGFSSSEVDYRWRVIKPAKQKLPSQTKNLVYTSYLGHPLGIAHDSYQASLVGEQATEYGLMSDNFYEPTPFSEAFVKKGPELRFVGGLGVGFDDLLKEQQWKPL